MWANVSTPTMTCCQQLQPLPDVGPTIACFLGTYLLSETSPLILMSDFGGQYHCQSMQPIKQWTCFLGKRYERTKYRYLTICHKKCCPVKFEDDFKHSRPKIVPFLSEYKYIYIFKLSLLNEIWREFEALYPAPGDLRLDDKKSVYTH